MSGREKEDIWTDLKWFFGLKKPFLSLLQWSVQYVRISLCCVSRDHSVHMESLDVVHHTTGRLDFYSALNILLAVYLKDYSFWTSAYLN